MDKIFCESCKKNILRKNYKRHVEKSRVHKLSEKLLGYEKK